MYVHFKFTSADILIKQWCLQSTQQLEWSGYLKTNLFRNTDKRQNDRQADRQLDRQIDS